MNRKFIFIVTMITLITISVVNVSYALYSNDKQAVLDSMLWNVVSSCLDDGYFQLDNKTFICVYLGEYDVL